MRQLYATTNLTLVCLLATVITHAQKMAFTISMPQPATHYYHVSLRCDGIKKETVEFRMPAWTTGYYQILDFGNYVENFQATDNNGKVLSWEKSGKNAWQVHRAGSAIIILNYDVAAKRSFVATNYLDEERGYMSPAGLFVYVPGYIKNPVTVKVEPYLKWNMMATGMDSIPGMRNTFTAPDFDILYDSPILAGNLESLPSFVVKGIPHYFVGYKIGDFDRNQFMADMKKIVETGSSIIGDIPYTHYSFLAIGPGGGGIEHLNSASVAFSGTGLNTPTGKRRMYSFLAHEYFHNYNVKRIRPIELGPFDYDKENRTNMLWVSEGFTVYYEYMIIRRAGLVNTKDLLDMFTGNIVNYENKPGHLFQSVTQASYETWSDGPFGRTGDELNKTISYYDKGPALGLLLDFAIRHETKNKQSLDDVMRSLYKEFYQQKKRGFTEAEFQKTCEKIAGKPLPVIFEYASTVKDIDYPKYLAYGGLAIDTVTHDLPGAWLGINTRQRNDSVMITNVDWQSPAWRAGLRSREAIIALNGNKATSDNISKLTAAAHEGETVKLTIFADGQQKEVEIVFGKKRERSYIMTPIANPDPLQQSIFNSWQGE